MSPQKLERPHLTVAAVVERDGRFLMVEERINGATVLNQPAGHWESGESLAEATARETLEETAWRVRIDSLVGIYNYRPQALNYGFLRFACAATALDDTGLPLDPAIERAVWLSFEEITACPERHRSPMVLRALCEYRAGHRLPLDSVQELPPGR